MQSGCFRCDIHEDLQQKNSILFSSLWSSKEDFEQHLRSDYFRNALLVLEMAEKKPEIRFDEISGSSGMETVEKARQCHR